MLSALVAFVVLFGLIKVFERKRDDLDNFNIATVAIVPILANILVGSVIGMAELQPSLLTQLLPGVVLALATFLLLWKNLEIPVGRSLIYTIAVVSVHEGFGLLLSLI